MEQAITRPKKYAFVDIESCNMCGNPTAKNKTMGIRLNRSQGFHPKSKTGIAVSVKKCSNCSLIYADPMPIPEDIQDHYGIPPEEYWNTMNFDWNEHYFSNEINKLQQLMSFRSGMKALDIGAGLGRTMISLEKAGFETFGIEPSLPFYQRAIEKMKINPVRLQQGSIENSVYEPDSFDLISFGAVLEHLYNPSKSIELALGWLKPGGIIHIEVPSSNHFPTRLINLFYKLKGTNYVSNLSPMHTPFHLYEFSLKSFEKISARLNYSIADSKIEVCEILNFPRFTHPLLKKWMSWTNSGLQLVVYLKKL